MAINENGAEESLTERTARLRAERAAANKDTKDTPKFRTNQWADIGDSNPRTRVQKYEEETASRSDKPIMDRAGWGR